MFKTSCYLARHVLDSVGDSFQGAKQCMDYLSAAASAVGAAGQQVKWVTPQGGCGGCFFAVLFISSVDVMQNCEGGLSRDTSLS